MTFSKKIPQRKRPDERMGGGGSGGGGGGGGGGWGKGVTLPPSLPKSTTDSSAFENNL